MRARRVPAVLLGSVLAAGCAATLTPEGAAVAVSTASVRGAEAPAVPSGCRLLKDAPPRSMSEADLAGTNAFREERNAAGASGANVLLVVERMVVGRRDSDCAATMRIEDCPSTLGAWYDVGVRAYACDPAGRAALLSRWPASVPAR